MGGQREILRDFDISHLICNLTVMLNLVENEAVLYALGIITWEEGNSKLGRLGRIHRLGGALNLTNSAISPDPKTKQQTHCSMRCAAHLN